MKTPIIAHEVNDATTHFLITRDDIVYVYTMGVQMPFKPKENAYQSRYGMPDNATEPENKTEEEPKRATPKRKVMG